MLESIRDFAELFGAAVRVASATESHRRPAPEDLKVLGIDRELPRAW
jgi:hypothetical protein